MVTGNDDGYICAVVVAIVEFISQLNLRILWILTSISDERPYLSYYFPLIVSHALNFDSFRFAFACSTRIHIVIHTVYHRLVSRLSIFSTLSTPIIHLFPFVFMQIGIHSIHWSVINTRTHTHTALCFWSFHFIFVSNYDCQYNINVSSFLFCFI